MIATRFVKNEIIALVGEAPRFDLGSSYGPNLRLEDLLTDDVDGSLKSTVLGYRTAEGDAQLRAGIAALHGVAPDDVVVTAGGMHALFLLAFILCERGDEAVIAVPVFPPARAALDAVGAMVRELPLSFGRGYRLDPEDLRPLLSEKTRIVSLASPQNPSGVAIPMETLRGILAIMEERSPQAFLVLDDTYREAAYGNDPTAPSALSLSPKVVTVASFSKCHGAPGLRLGWAITRDASLREQLVLGKFNTVVSSPAIEEALALRILALRDRILRERRVFLADCLARTQSWIQSNASFVDWVRPDAGAICCVRLRSDMFNDAGVHRFYEMLQNVGVRVSKGEWFGDEARVFRLGFGRLPVTELAPAFEALTGALSRSAGAIA
jgi:aspartate/methionine/tyrosine aminotransferase